MCTIVLIKWKIQEELIINNAEAKSTPVVTKIKEKEYSMDDIFNFIRAMSDDIKPVSYTHLDVYKRQDIWVNKLNKVGPWIDIIM